MDAVTIAGDTPLHDAAGYGQAAFCKMLLRRGANPRVRSTKNKSPLDYAQARGYPACVAQLEAFEAKARTQEAAAKAAREAAEREASEACRAKAQATAPGAAPAASRRRGSFSAPAAAAPSTASPKSSPRTGATTSRGVPRSSALESSSPGAEKGACGHSSLGAAPSDADSRRDACCYGKPVAASVRKQCHGVPGLATAPSAASPSSSPRAPSAASPASSPRAAGATGAATPRGGMAPVSVT